jgi:cyclophilin family peptidyl-prolyl cis-trans isomerase
MSRLLPCRPGAVLRRWAPSAALLAALTACGGGGGGGNAPTTPTTPTTPANVAPVVSVQVSGTATAAATTTFDTAGTADPDGTIATRNWSYGDGSTGSADSHVYAAAGTYTATLTVTDNQGASASKAVTVTVAAAAPVNQPPVAAAVVTTAEPIVFLPVAFNTTGTGDPDGSIVASSWDYGDGQTGTANTHTYATAGNFTATYTVTDNGGKQASKSVAVTVAKCSAAGTTAAQTSPYYNANSIVCMQTSMGEIVFETYRVSLNGLTYAPITSDNFLRYVDDGFYSGTIFHRVYPQLPSPLPVIQAGGFISGPTVKPPTHAPIQLESQTGLRNDQYTLAMARTEIANSATSQFFINFAANHNLDYQSPTSPGYAVFGLVLPGTSRSVVDAIAAVATTTKAGLSDVPVIDVTILGMVRLP